MKPKESKIGYILAFLVISVLGFCVYYFLIKPDSNVENTTNENEGVKIIDSNAQTETEAETNIETSTVNETEKPAEPETEEEETVSSSTDFSNYNSNKQTVGVASNDAVFTLDGIKDTKKDGYHEFKFTLVPSGSEAVDSPFIVATYNSSQATVKLDLNNVTKDESGIGYQKSRLINEQGITKLYHNISSDNTEELYDIGVTKKTVYELSSVMNDDNTWSVILNVKYPGGTVSTGVIGSENFSKDIQAIDGALSPDNPKVLSYSYSSLSGVLTIVFNVSGTSSRPFPSAVAKYDADLLTLEFTELTTDSVYKAIDGKKIGGVTIETSRSGLKSTYNFVGASKEFRLSASSSPNQVVMEIKL